MSPKISPVLEHVSVHSSFLQMCNTLFCLANYQLMNLQMFFPVFIINISALTICLHICMWTYFLFLLCSYLGVELLGYMVTLI